MEDRNRLCIESWYHGYLLILEYFTFIIILTNNKNENYIQRLYEKLAKNEQIKIPVTHLDDFCQDGTKYSQRNST